MTDATVTTLQLVKVSAAYDMHLIGVVRHPRLGVGVR